MKRLTCLILVLAMLLALAACGGEPDPNAGVYKATTAEMSGISLDVDSLFGEDLSIELKNGGRATMTMKGQKYSLRWELVGTDLCITASDGTLTGSLENDIIVLDMSGATVTFVRVK
ncbi:MAG: hypothetical protein K6G17_01820 [Oscillospiraceae bacterium]|nr:hypothetical protein [Oscillospiraceae bacterium]